MNAVGFAATPDAASKTHGAGQPFASLSSREWFGWRFYDCPIGPRQRAD